MAEYKLVDVLPDNTILVHKTEADGSRYSLVCEPVGREGKVYMKDIEICSLVLEPAMLARRKKEWEEKKSAEKLKAARENFTADMEGGGDDGHIREAVSINS